MATQAKTTPNPLAGDATSEETAARIRQLNETILESLKSSSLAALANYESMLQNLASYELQLSKASQVGWFTTVVDAHAQFVRDSAAALTKAARGLLS
jgi:hypothetical protein